MDGIRTGQKQMQEGVLRGRRDRLEVGAQVLGIGRSLDFSHRVTYWPDARLAELVGRLLLGQVLYFEEPASCFRRVVERG